MHRAQAEEFIYREVRLLDQGRFGEWRALFAPDSLYWVPSGDPDRDPGQHCSIIHAGPQELDDRLARASSTFFWAGDPPLRTVHMVGNVLVEHADSSLVTLSCNQVIYLYRDGDQRRDQPLHTLPAQCEYRLALGATDARIAFKKVVLLQGDGLVPLLPAII